MLGFFCLEEKGFVKVCLAGGEFAGRRRRRLFWSSFLHAFFCFVAGTLDGRHGGCAELLGTFRQKPIFFSHWVWLSLAGSAASGACVLLCLGGIAGASGCRCVCLRFVGGGLRIPRRSRFHRISREVHCWSRDMPGGG